MEIERQPPDKQPYKPEAPTRSLDITAPLKWQMALRVYLESLSGPDADQWLSDFRVIYSVAGKVVRDRVHRHVTNRCFVCDRIFVEGRPAGEAGYFDLDRNYIHIYCCNPAEYPQLLMKVKAKEDTLRGIEEQAEKAARQALVAIRQGHRG